MVYWISLQNMLGYGNTSALRTLLYRFGSPKEILEASDEELSNCGVTKAQLKRRGELSPKAIEKIIMTTQKENISVLPFDSPLYPNKLRNINEPPVVLYVIGDERILNDSLSIGVIGTRRITEYGKRAAFSLSARLALGGAVIVSGGAVGGDTFAHLGALAVSGKTVCVTGGGASSKYLKVNSKLRDSIVASGGALVSEFSPHFTPRANSFHVRNRIISGLSDAVAVIEAPISSGVMITAGTAAEQGREVYAMPGAPERKEFEGTNKLISFGARPIISPKDILSDYEGKYKTVSIDNISVIDSETLGKLYKSATDIYEAKPSKDKRYSKNKTAPKRSIIGAKEKKFETVSKGNETAPKKDVSPRRDISGLSEECVKVYNALTNEPCLSDDIIEKTSLNTATVLKALTLLEIKGLVSAFPGSRYSLK